MRHGVRTSDRHHMKQEKGALDMADEKEEDVFLDEGWVSAWVMRPYYLAKASDARREARWAFWFMLLYGAVAASVCAAAYVNGWDTVRIVGAIIWTLVTGSQAWFWRRNVRLEGEFLNQAG